MFDRDAEGASIELRALTKHYPGQTEPAVDNVTLDIPAGELVVLVGPSGCGKTTTMKMINRLVEPTSGEIRIGGEDVLALPPDELRRHIGYVIQQIGLFPHLTVGQNIGLVPRLLGWPAARVAARTEELLALVNLEPRTFHDRYPRQLSGGQQQRVGVARALAADPPVMLMDEPFGATDPITREHLQNEFVKLKRRLRKTIIFVTHDFEEAIKLGDRIAVLRDRSHVAQYDTPAGILAAPADDYVAGFIGEDATLKRLALLSVSDIESDIRTDDGGADHDDPGRAAAREMALPEVGADASLREALDAMVAHGGDRCRTPAGVLTYAVLCRAVGAAPDRADRAGRREVTAGDR